MLHQSNPPAPRPGTPAPAHPNVRPNIATVSRPVAPAPVQTLALDNIIATMVNAAEGVSDLLFVVGRPPQIEVYGKLRGVDVEGLMPTLQPAHVEAIALKMMSAVERLAVDLKNNG